MNDGTVYADCPCCGARLEVRRQDGKVVAHWTKRTDGATTDADPLKAAAERQKAEKAKLDHYLTGAKDVLEQRKKEAQEKFDKERDRIFKEKDFTRPDNPFDLD